jgi:hypothetical protein
MSARASLLRGLSVSLLVAAAAVGCSKGASTTDAQGAVGDHVAFTPPPPPGGPVPIPYPNAIAAPAESTAAAVAAPAPSPETLAAPAAKGSRPKETGQAAGKRQHAPIQ